MSSSSPVSQWLEKSAFRLNAWAMFAAFATYFCMYMFRKPFTAASYQGETIADWDQKSVLVGTQVLGYLISKLIGVKVISQMRPSHRAAGILILIAIAEGALLLFSVLPSPWHIVAIGLNGLPLGMVFGLVLGFLEGRRMTEALTAGLCTSFILAGGFSKTVGQYLLEFLQNQLQLQPAVAERWMPFLAGALFIVPICFSVWMLTQIPAPNLADMQQRSQRVPMTGEDRMHMLSKYGITLLSIAIVYFVATILRSLRDDFAPEILAGLSKDVRPGDFTTIELQVALLVLIVNGASVWIRDNLYALYASLAVSAAGFAIILMALRMREDMGFSPIVFMTLLGAGLYLPYVAIHTTVFERLIALTRDRGNIGFLMYVVDSIGYVGYVGVMFFRTGASTRGGVNPELFLNQFLRFCWWGSLVSLAFVLIASVFIKRLRQNQTESSGAVGSRPSGTEG
ncbi:MAG: DUF5690 family protein [Pirellula sp.]|jgi:hypothetical protein|nr:DUF5690 family protein [Pirellula sp.]